MTAKEYLQQAYRLNNQISSKIMEMESLREISYSAPSNKWDGRYCPNHSTEAPFTQNVEKMQALQEDINNEISKLLAFNEQMRNAISSVSDIDERMVLSYRYIHGMTWEKIGQKLHANGTTVSRWHKKALQHFVLPENPIRI